MKKIINKISVVVVLIVLLASCDDFTEINTQPDAFTADEVSAKFLITGTQIRLYAPDRFPYWRAQLIHADRYAGQVTFGHKGSWWSGALGYDYNGGYTNAAYGWISGYNSILSTYMNFVGPGGDLENERYYAIGLITKGLYYQSFTDTYGMLPYTEASDPDIITPKFDTQAVIYKGIIDELNEAMLIIGDNVDTGSGAEFLSNTDLFFNGDLQKWKKLANTLKLRMGLRARGAAGAEFADAAISEALGADLISDFTENALMEKDIDISQWSNAAYGDVWHNFGGNGSKWNMSEVLVAYLRDNNDPRLTKMVEPIVGGTVTWDAPSDGSGVDLYLKRTAYLLETLDEAGVDFSATSTSTSTTVVVAEGDWYVGQPSRLNGEIKTYVSNQLFSLPTPIVINQKNNGNPIYPEVVMTAAEGNLLQAEAAVRGLGSGGDAQQLYQEGIRQAMLLWGVNEGDIGTYLANEDMAQLNGTMEENLEKIAVQRWIAAYTDGFEAWAIVRDTGYPSELSGGVEDKDIFALGTLNGDYPQRMRYGSQTYNTNGANTDAANSVQGPDNQATVLWWAE